MTLNKMNHLDDLGDGWKEDGDYYSKSSLVLASQELLSCM